MQKQIVYGVFAFYVFLPRAPACSLKPSTFLFLHSLASSISPLIREFWGIYVLMALRIMLMMWTQIFQQYSLK